MRQVVVGFVGEKGGGKDTAIKMLARHLGPEKVGHICASKFLAQILQKQGFGEKPPRENFIGLVEAIESSLGEGTLSHCWQQKIKACQLPFPAFDAMRLKTDPIMIRSFPRSFTVYITANSALRHQRSQKRGQKGGESTMSLSQFMEEEVSGTEQLIPLIGKEADMVIINNGSQEELDEKVQGLAEMLAIMGK